MKDQILESFSQLKNFIETHDLQDNRSNIHFNALITIETATSEMNKKKMTARVSFDVSPRAGQLTLNDHDLNAYEFPEQFYPDYNKFTHVDNSYLKIEGIHRQNSRIGEYVVEIYPLGKV